MPEVVFVDTSVLLNILDVPGKNSHRELIVTEYRTLREAGAILVVPIAAVVEVGNHLAQLGSGHDRRDRARRFEAILRAALERRAPWVVSGASWDGEFLLGLLNGDGLRPGLVDLCASSVGSGDASILLELQRYRLRIDLPSGMPIRLWTLDVGLGSYA